MANIERQASEALTRFVAMGPGTVSAADEGLNGVEGPKKAKAFVRELVPLMEPPKKEASFVATTNANFGGTMSRCAATSS